MSATQTDPRRGSALLAVMWLSVALSAIAFSLAVTVRGETERTTTATESMRAYYLAEGAVQRALLYMAWAPYALNPDGTSRYYSPGTPRLYFRFPGGEAVAEIIPESAKININHAPPEEMFHLLTNLGAGPDRAREIALGIVEWRTTVPEETEPAGQPESSSAESTFSPRHASFEEIEELLLVRGVTPELFYGTYERDSQGRLVPRAALRDCVTVYGVGAVDVNTAPPEVLASVGLAQDVVAAIVAARQQAPFRNLDQLSAMVQDPAVLGRLRVGGNTTFTVRATARLRLANGLLSDQRRSVAAVVKAPSDEEPRYTVLRWYDNVWVQ